MEHNPYSTPDPHQGQGPAMGPKPKNWLVESILVTLLCCLPLGIAAIVYAAQVDSKYSAGDAHGALSSAKTARLLCLISLVGGLLSIVAYAILVAVATVNV